MVANADSLFLSMLVGSPQGGFLPATSLPSFGTSSCLTVTDWNRDGDLDLGVCYFEDGMGDFMSRRLGFPGAAFGNDFLISGVVDLAHIVTGDFTRDENPDVISSAPQGDYRRAAGDGTGGFVGSSTVFSLGGPVADVVAGDFDQDLDLDLAIADTAAGQVRLQLGAGDLTFTPGASVAVAAPRRLAAADFDGDGDLDLAAAGTGAASILLGGPGASFAQASSTPLGGGAPTGIGVADFNGDEDLDLAVAADDGMLSLLAGSDGDTLVPAGARQLGGPLTSLAVGHFNRGDRPDLAVTRAGATTSALMLVLNVSQTQIAADATSLAFGTQAQGTLGAARTVTVTSAGERPLRVRSIRSGGDDFVVTTDSCTGEVVPAGRTCTFAVRFAPAAAGARTATLRIASDALGSPELELPLSGTGGDLPAGPAGAPGATGQPSVRERLVTLFAADRLRVRARQRLRVGFVSTTGAVVRVELRRGRTLVRRLAATAVAGRNVLALRAPARPGRYTLALMATGGGETVTDTARLTVTRRRP